MGILSKLKKWNKADYVLLAAVGVFFLAVAVKMAYPDTLAAKLFLTVAEAALVGGTADWFAVTALFRRPLGFPYHTALVPRNRKRLIDALAKAVEDDFLSKEVIKKRLAATNLTELFINKIENIENIENKSTLSFARPIMTGMIGKAAASLDPARAGRCGGEFIKKTLQNEPIAPFLAQAAQWAVNTGKTALLYDFLLKELSQVVNRPETRQKIYDYLQNLKTGSTSGNWLSTLTAWIMEETDSLNLAEAADILQTEILAALNKIQAENHPVRRWFLEQTALTAESLAARTDWAEAAEAGKKAFFKKIDLAAPLAAAVVSLQEEAGRQQLLADRIMEFFILESDKYWQTFKADRQMQEKTENFFHCLADSLLESHHDLIGTVVTDALSRLTEQGFVHFVEEKASEDLAWIRINGVVVGSFAGLLLGLLLHFAYDPFLNFFSK